jgi:hypothetical protein
MHIAVHEHEMHETSHRHLAQAVRDGDDDDGQGFLRRSVVSWAEAAEADVAGRADADVDARGDQLDREHAAGLGAQKLPPAGVGAAGVGCSPRYGRSLDGRSPLPRR